MRIRLIVPRELDHEGRAARLARIRAKTVGTDVELDCVGVRRSFDPGVHHDETLLAVAVAEAGVSAEADGCDALVVDSVADPALYALRSRLSIPVVGAGGASFALAVTLGGRFGVVLGSEAERHALETNLALHDLRYRCASIRFADLSAAGGAATLLAAARHTVEAGADVVVIGTTGMPDAAAEVAGTLGRPVLDAGIVGLKTAERLVRLGLTHSKTAFPSPKVTQDEKLAPLIADA